MKNDPHVTEVSDDGALLKRYRNEIVDLKRRLQEVGVGGSRLQSWGLVLRVNVIASPPLSLFQVSGITQTTATEKEVLSQLLQEKDQLQREQEDRIRNLTKLLVTGSNLAPAKKVRTPQERSPASPRGPGADGSVSASEDAEAEGHLGREDGRAGPPTSPRRFLGPQPGGTFR